MKRSVALKCCKLSSGKMICSVRGLSLKIQVTINNREVP